VKNVFLEEFSSASSKRLPKKRDVLVAKYCHNCLQYERVLKISDMKEYEMVNQSTCNHDMMVMQGKQM
jgi:hypothetical protein